MTGLNITLIKHRREPEVPDLPNPVRWFVGACCWLVLAVVIPFLLWALR